MSLPATISVSFDFSQGATFGYPFTIGDPINGVLTWPEASPCIEGGNTGPP